MVSSCNELRVLSLSEIGLLCLIWPSRLRCAIFPLMNEKRELLRHILASLAYRAARALDGAPDEFANFAGAGRQPTEILAHMGDLFDWSLSISKGQESWHVSAPLDWPAEKQRFFASLAAFDAYLASAEPMHAPIERLLQGPVCDAFSHVGQLAMMRRLSGSPIHGENYYVASVQTGQVGASQPKPVQSF